MFTESACLTTVALPQWAVAGPAGLPPARTLILASRNAKAQSRDGNHLVKRSRRICSGMDTVSTLGTMIDKLDERIGDGLEHILCAHHRRRLRRLGWGEVPPDEGADDGAGGSGRLGGRARVRAGNSMEVLVDGEQALPVFQAAI